MKKQKLLITVDASTLKKAIEKDIDLIWEHANYTTFNYEETLETLYYCGIEALPNFKKELDTLSKQNIKYQTDTFLNKLKLILWILVQ